MSGTNSNMTPVRVLRVFPAHKPHLPDWFTRPRLQWIVGGIVLWVAVFSALQFVPHTGAIVHMRLQSDAPAGYIAQWYFDRGKGPTSPWFSESESVTVRLKQGENSIMFRLPVGVYRALRFDPINADAHVKIESMQWQGAQGELTGALDVGNMGPLANIAHVEMKNGLDIWPVSGNGDPQMQLPLSKPLNLTTPLQSTGDRLMASVEIVVGLLLFAWLVITQISLHHLVAAGMTLAAGLILAMIVVTGGNLSAHPDEVSHLSAYQYYTEHILPPAVDDPATAPSTSVWGFSYLFELDVVYDIAARVTSTLKAFTQDEILSARLFQFGLWAILCILAICRRRWALTLSVVLLSPQIWYVFSYFNADAFPLFLSLIAAMLIADQGSGLHRYLQTGDKRSPALWVVAACIGLLLVSKRNYLPLVPAYLLWLGVVHLGLRVRILVPIFGGLWLLGVAVFIGDVPAFSHWRIPLNASGLVLCGGAAAMAGWRNWQTRETRAILLRLIAFALICAAVALPRVAWDVRVNGWPSQKAALIHAVAEARAGTDFKPSVVAQGKGNPTIALAARGVPLSQLIFAPYGWAYSSLASAFGVYGYMNIFAPAWFYMAIAALSLLIMLIAMWAIRRARPEQAAALVVTTFGGVALVLTSSIMLSWVSAMQAQGRYLFPAVAMLALLVAQGAHHLPRRIFVVTLATALLLSASSFAFLALQALAHMG